jgi:arylsulfatase A-like enzyme
VRGSNRLPRCGLSRLGHLLLIGGLVWACGDRALPPEITIEEVVSELAPPLAPDAVVDGTGAGGVHRAVLDPGDRGSGGNQREALMTPPPARVRFPVAAAPGMALRFSAGVDLPKERQGEEGGDVVFRVTVNGRDVFEHVSNPVARRRDRRWTSGMVDLAPWAGRPVEVVLETRAADPSRPPLGTPGWSRVRLVRLETRQRQQAQAGPNILFLLVDTLRADRLGVYGASPSPSPTLDRFAARGTVFETAVAQASWTMPAVASIFTGLHPRDHGAVGLDVHAPAELAGAGTLLPDSVTTIAEVAQDAGVSTFGVSTNLLIDRATNMAQGFESFVLLPYDGKRRNYVAAPVVHEQLRGWLRRARGRRFFAYLHYMEPHGPYTPPAARRPTPPAGIRPDLARGWVRDVARAVNRGRMRPPPPAVVDYLRDSYDEEIRTWDEAFADLLGELANEGLLDRTIVVVAADHGEEFLEHGKLTHGEHLYEEILRVPLVIVGPGIPAERRSDLAQQIDLLPTIAALLGAPPPPGLPGRDLLATRSATEAISEIVAGFGDTGAGHDTVALHTGRWKVIHAPDATELYDLSRDPAEETNLAPGSPDLGGLVARIERRDATAAVRRAHGGGSAGDMQDRLRALGYID